MAVPWPESEMLALALSPDFARDKMICVAVRDLRGSIVEVWQGSLAGGWTPVAAYDSAVPRATIAVPHDMPWDGTWYAAVGDQVYGPLGQPAGQRGSEQRRAGAALAPSRPGILSLALLPGPASRGLLAATGSGIYITKDGGREWQVLRSDDGPSGVVAVATTASGALGLEVGGTLWRGRWTAD